MRITVIGTAPLLMHNVRLADDRDPYARAVSKITSKRTKTDDDRFEIDWLSFAGGLYWNEELGPYMPAENVFRCLMQAGAVTRAGKKVERGVNFLGTQFRLEYDGPRDVESLWGDGESRWVDRRMVTVTRNRIPRVRPIFPEWSLSFEVELDTQEIDAEEFTGLVGKAGRSIGLGDYRRFYGRFDGKVEL